VPTLDRYPPALPPMSTATVRFLLGAVPALVTVVFAGLIALLALLMDKQRRDYAIQVADCFRKFAAVLVGAGPVQDDVAKGHDQRSTDPLRQR
jgi:hypothetical protein